MANLTDASIRFATLHIRHPPDLLCLGHFQKRFLCWHTKVLQSYTYVLPVQKLGKNPDRLIRISDLHESTPGWALCGLWTLSKLAGWASRWNANRHCGLSSLNSVMPRRSPSRQLGGSAYRIFKGKRLDEPASERPARPTTGTSTTWQRT